MLHLCWSIVLILHTREEFYLKNKCQISDKFKKVEGHDIGWLKLSKDEDRERRERGTGRLTFILLAYHTGIWNKFMLVGMPEPLIFILRILYNE